MRRRARVWPVRSPSSTRRPASAFWWNWPRRTTREREPSRAPVRLKRLVIGGRDPKETAATFQTLFGLTEIAMNGGLRTMLAAGRGAVLVVPADEVGGTEGMVALSLVADDFAGLTAAFDRAKVRCIRGTGEVTVEPVSSHGVHLHISRYE